MKTSILLMCCLVVSTITFAQFGSQQIISNNGGECKFCGGDIDGDGDIDIVVTVIPNGVEWFKNTDGLGNFILGQNVSTDHDVIRAAFLSDIDGDNDLDVFVASQNDGKIVWYENTDGLGTFGPQQLIGNISIGVQSIHGTDFDGDTDIDLVMVNTSANIVAWYENTNGQGTFSEAQLISNTLDGPIAVYAADLDGDLDQDVLVATFTGNSIVWFENTNGQ
ncbi:VCBS repeat-containing protein, partial [Altibacter sp.]|uniref:FG-GAP repeat domain-containing protein n=1 Tax=Altibacter sp. TaxID=2024823 RepID=UPI002582B020